MLSSLQNIKRTKFKHNTKNYNTANESKNQKNVENTNIEKKTQAK